MLMTNEEPNHMKYLKIEDNKGYYRQTSETEDDTWVEIDKIGKEDLMILLDKAISSDFEMDEYKEEDLSHKAHQIVYNNIYEKFSHLYTNKDKFKDESEQLYKNAIEKYSNSEEEGNEN